SGKTLRISQQRSGLVAQRKFSGSSLSRRSDLGQTVATFVRPRRETISSRYASVSGNSARVSINITGRLLSISAAIWRSTAESAPKLETSAIRPLKRSSIAARSTVRGSMPANSATSRSVFSKLPNKAASRDAIKSLLEWRHADSPVSGKKILLGALPQLQIGIDKRFDRADDVV